MSSARSSSPPGQATAAPAGTAASQLVGNVRLSIREACADDLDSIVNYWLGSDSSYLEGMGVDFRKMPSQTRWRQLLTGQFQLPVEEKQASWVIWLADGLPIGHSNINRIEFGE